GKTQLIELGFLFIKVIKIKQIQTPTAYIVHILISSFKKI
ncbi:hypothetical protein BSU6633_00385, partial [Bacillus spizizenii ATCC 6633 = JCM 2499]